MGIVAACAVPHPPLIIPEVGKGQEKGIARTIESYKEVMRRIAAARPQTVVVITPHTDIYADYMHISPGKSATGSFARFGAPQVQLSASYDEEFVGCVEKLCRENQIQAGTLGEQHAELDHATLIPLYFLNQFLTDYQVVRVGISNLSLLEHYSLGQLLERASTQLTRRVAIIASGDLSHKLKADGPYGFSAAGPEFDERVMQALGSADFLDLLRFEPQLCQKAAECGHRPFVMLAGALDRRQVSAERLSYEGPFGVGYGVVSFTLGDPDEKRNFAERYLEEVNAEHQKRVSRADPYTALAIATIEQYVREGSVPPLPDRLPSELTEKQAAVFVSIKKFGNLRGCIGTLRPVTASIAEEIQRNAVLACSKDPRFNAVGAGELTYLEVSVDVLTLPEPVDGLDKLDPKRYGVIVSSGGRSGVLLPDLEGVDSVEQQIAICRQKGGIGPQEPVSLQRFEVIRHH